MPKFCKSDLESSINSLASAASSSSDACNLISAVLAIDQLTASRYSAISGVGDIPDASTIPSGHIVHVGSLKTPVINSRSNKWIGLDGRLLRRDSYTRELWTWGWNNYGELGDNTVNHKYSSPVTTAGGGTNWCSISGGYHSKGAIKTDGTLWTWGRNSYGQLGDGTTSNRSSPGTTVWGGTNWCQVDITRFFSAAIKTDGTLWTWGYNNCGQLGTGTTTSRSSPGTTTGGGTNWCFVSVSKGGIFGHTIALKTDGTLWAWGTGLFGRLGDGAQCNRSSPVISSDAGTNWCAASAGCGFSLGLKTDGTLWSWGKNSEGQLGAGFTGNTVSNPTMIGSGTDWSKITTGRDHSAAIKTDGTLWTWGCNAFGVLGDGSYYNTSMPNTTIGGGTNWSNAGFSYFGSAAIKTDGTLWTWGIQWNLGRDMTTSNCIPAQINGGGTNWDKVCNSMAIKKY